MWVCLRRRQLVHRGAALGVRAGPPRADRDAARRQHHVRQRSLRRGVRLVLRSPERLRLRHQFAWAACSTGQSPTSSPTTTGTASGSRGPASSRAAGRSRFAIPFRSFRFREGGTSLGHELPAPRRAGRTRVAFSRRCWRRGAGRRCRACRRRRRSPVSRCPASSATSTSSRTRSARWPTDKRARRPYVERSGRRDRLRREMGHPADAHRRHHGQHRLRSGRRRRSAGQPDALQPASSRRSATSSSKAPTPSTSAAVGRAAAAPAGRRRAGRRAEHQHDAAALLQPAHRPQQRPRGPDPRRRAAARTIGPVAVRRAQHADRRVRVGALAPSTNFTVLQGQPRHLPAQPRRRAWSRRRDPDARPRHRAASRRRQPGLRRGRHGEPDRRGLASSATWRRPTRPGAGTARATAATGDGSTGTPTATACRPSTCTSAPTFNPEVGFLRRTAFRRSFGQARFSPRPGGAACERSIYEASADYITDTQNRPESKELQGTYRMELENSDIWSIDATQNYERLDHPLRSWAGHLRAARRIHASTRCVAPTRSASSGACPASSSTAYGGFYDGTLTELTWRGPRRVLEPVLPRADDVLEPRRW